VVPEGYYHTENEIPSKHIVKTTDSSDLNSDLRLVLSVMKCQKNLKIFQQKNMSKLMH